MDHGAGPRELTLYVTAACDAACDFCKRETDAGTERAGTMSAALVAEVLDRFPTLRSCCIAGFGEPLLVKHLPAIVDLLRSRRIYVGIVTNGSRLLERREEIRSMGLGHLSVSLNAADAEEHRAILKVDVWDATLAGIRTLLDDGVKVGASFVVRRGNVSRVPDYLALALDLRLKFAHLHNILPHGGPRDFAFLAGVLREGSPEANRLREMEAGWNRAAELNGEDGAPEVSWPALLPPPGAPGPLGCHSPFVSIGVDARGSVTACRRVQEPVPAHGNFRDPDVWIGPHFSRYRDELSGRCAPSETCLNCFGRIRG